MKEKLENGNVLETGKGYYNGQSFMILKDRYGRWLGDVYSPWKTPNKPLDPEAVKALRAAPAGPKRYLYTLDAGFRYANGGGHIFATRDEIATVVGRELYLGEVAGKHSEIVCEVSFTEHDVPDEALETIVKIFGSCSGIGSNILDHINGEYDEDA